MDKEARNWSELLRGQYSQPAVAEGLMSEPPGLAARNVWR